MPLAFHAICVNNVTVIKRRGKREMTFAAWEKMIRMFNPYVLIFTETDERGEVIKAWTQHYYGWEK